MSIHGVFRHLEEESVSGGTDYGVEKVKGQDKKENGQDCVEQLMGISRG